MMKLNKKMLSLLSVGLIAMAGVAQAAEDNKTAEESKAVLFKIHDVVPVKNSDGLVTSCDVGATFYNRTAQEIKNTSLNLVWTDDVVGETISQEDRVARENERANRQDVARYNTSSYTSKDIILKLRLPPMKSQQQISLKTKVQTDRCFLLLNDMEIEITSCGTSGSGDDMSSSGCSNLFTYISPKSPEYYNDFQEESLDVTAMQEQSILNGKKQEMEEAYLNALEEIQALNNKLAEVGIQ